MDVHVPLGVTQGLRARGVDVITAQDDGSATLSDSELLDRAAALGRATFTHDSDFLREAATRQAAGHAFSGVVYVPHQKLPIGKMIDDLELIAKAYEPSDMGNRVEYLPL
jgi:hypothetical protein